MINIVAKFHMRHCLPPLYVQDHARSHARVEATVTSWGRTPRISRPDQAVFDFPEFGNSCSEHLFSVQKGCFAVLELF